MSLKKISVDEFSKMIKNEIEDFQAEMEKRNFSNRNQNKWFMLMMDYFGFTDPILGTNPDDNEYEDLDEDTKERMWETKDRQQY